ncbi:hypothetical protein S83_035360 [Arachis hypogaea]
MVANAVMDYLHLHLHCSLVGQEGSQSMKVWMEYQTFSFCLFENCGVWSSVSYHSMVHTNERATICLHF